MSAKTHPSSRAEERTEKTKRNHPSSPSTPNPQILGSPRTSSFSPLPKLLDPAKSKPLSSSSLQYHSSRRSQTIRQPASPPSRLQSKQFYQESTYARTTHSHISVQSQYQVTSTPDLPSANKWPHHNSIADRKRMNDDLLGLNLTELNYDPYSMTARIPEEDFESASASHLESLSADMNAGASGGVEEYETWRYEGGTQDAIFAWGHDGSSSVRRGYTYDFVNSIDDSWIEL
ncbi:hypothetical protein EG329_006664 [Mollisiaceae sp. DMI_Dod_QoI]|nr:hypothetical protein EG329_006664 [Helotiales sp. DMI_Dod_QoI]